MEMNSNNLNINSNVTLSFDAMDKTINDLEAILIELYKEVLKLNDDVWKAHEKEVIDSTFVPFLQKFSNLYPNYLRVRVQYARDAVKSHQELDKENSALKGILG